MSEGAGRYVVVRAGDVVRDEWTAIGVICYGSDGQQVYSRFDTNRAVQRGDMPDDAAMRSYVADYAASVPTIDDVLERLTTTGHAMSFVQMREPRVYLLGFEEGVAEVYLSKEPVAA